MWNMGFGSAEIYGKQNTAYLKYESGKEEKRISNNRFNLIALLSRFVLVRPEGRAQTAPI